MVAHISGNFVFTKFKYVVYNRGKLEIGYVNDKEGIKQVMASKPFDYTGLVVTDVTPTEEQAKRLSEVNELKLERGYHYIHDVRLYVERNVMTNQSSLLKPLADKCVDDTKTYLIHILQADIKKLKDETANGGISLFGRRFDSNEHARVSVLGYITKVLKDKLLNNELDVEALRFTWKDFDNNFTELKFGELSQLSDALLLHVESSFSAEHLALKELEKKTVIELLSYPSTSQYYRDGRDYAGPDDSQLSNVSSIYQECYNKLVKK